MNLASASLAELRALIGRPVRLRGIPCRVTEVLEAPPALVLTPMSRRPFRQVDVHGRPWETLGETFTLPLLAADGIGPSEASADLEWPEP